MKTYSSRITIGLVLALQTAPYTVQAQEESAEGEFVFEEIVVTSRKREESLQDVPLSVQAFAGVDLERNRIDNVEDLIGTVPGLSVSSNVLSPGKDFLNLVLRGVGSQSAGAPAVGTFVDGAYVPALSFDVAFMDVERVEVLRGPQGTLFGRNTQGGALNIVLRRPDEESRGRVAFTFDEFETYRAQAAVSGPLSETVYGSIALDASSTDGYLKNTVLDESADDQTRFAGRLALRYAPTESFEINLAIDGSQREGLDGFPGVTRGSEDFEVRSDFQQDGEYENYGGALNVDWMIGSVDVKSITAFREVTTFLPFDFDGSPERGPNVHDLQSEQSVLSQELRASGSYGENLNWLVGAYIFKEDSLTDRAYELADVDAFPGGIFIDKQIQDISRDGYALFADITWQLMDRMELSAGVRFSDESVDSEVTLDYTLPGIVTIVDAGTASISETNVSPTASLRYEFTDEITGYARYARGYRAGGFPYAPASASTNISFEAESSDNYEIGLKGNVLDNRLRFDISVFQVDISDQQLSTIVFLNGDPNLPVASVGNAGKSRSKGFEVQMQARPAANFELSANIGLTDAKYIDYVDTVGLSRAGEEFPYVPKWTAQLGASYTFDLGKTGDLTVGASYRYVDEILSGSGVDVDIQFPVDSYDIVDLKASLERGDWAFDVFVDNLANDFVETRIFNAFFYAQPRPFSIVLPPRRIGARISYRF